MPAIRNFTTSYETGTGDSGLRIPGAANESGDLLLMFCMSDTGAVTTFPTVPPTGWNYLEMWYNTTPMISYYKISSGSEGDAQIAGATSETYNGSMVSIRDVDVVTPLSVTTASAYVESNSDSEWHLSGTFTGIGQSFTTPASTTATRNLGCYARSRFYIKKVGSPTGSIVSRLYTHGGSLGTTSVPTTRLASSINVDVSTLQTASSLVEFPFDKPWYQFASGTNYVVTLEFTGSTTDYVVAGYDASAPSHAGNMCVHGTGSWTAQAGRDLCFYAERFTLFMSNLSSVARTQMPTITTERNDSMLIYLGGGSASAGTPSFIEGPVTQVFAQDGAAESHCFGWGFIRTAGAGPSTVYCSNAVPGASCKGVGWVNPPTGSGATVIPPYVVDDACTFVDPIAGTSAYNSNTALAATADTNFGTSLGGFTANDATVAAITDVGINSFHSMGGLTNAATANQVSGAETVIASANRFNMTNKNLLCHIRASTPAHLQRFTSVASRRGAWMGVRSNTGSGGATTGYKIWQVHGVDAPWGSGAHIPIVINSSAGNLIASSGSLDQTVITSVGFWTSGIGTLTAQMGFGMLWLMDTTVIAGGNALEPLNIEGIVAATARGKERVSALRQGEKQMLLLQKLQIGDGGTNPVYLNLESTAIEFPRQYNSSSAEVNYNSVDNAVGLQYYAGPSDTIIHKESIINSRSRYYWGLHSGSSTSATYDFSGLQVIGMGSGTLNRGITVTDLTINNYITLDISSASLNTCFITNVPTASNSITLNAQTTIVGSTINVYSVSAGNYLLSTANPSNISTTSFFGGGGHALRLTTSGTYDFTGNTFTSFGANDTSGSAIFNESGGLVTLNITNGDTPTVRNSFGSTTTINNPVTLEINGVTEGTRCTMIGTGGAQDGVTLLSGYANSSGVVSASYNGSTPQSVIVRARNSGLVAAVIQDDGGAFTDYTNDARDKTGSNDVVLLPAVPAVSDAAYIAGFATFGEIEVYVTSAGTTYVITWEYWNGASWSSLTVVDPSDSFKTTGWHSITFTKPIDWATTTINGQGPFYYVRVRVTTGGGTGPSLQEISLHRTTKYEPFTLTTTIESTGLTTTAVWIVDSKAR
jgi:hypothetical protein